MIQIEAMNALATNGKQAIDIITEIINSPEIDKQVKTHALVVMETIKNKDNQTDHSCFSSAMNLEQSHSKQNSIGVIFPVPTVVTAEDM